MNARYFGLAIVCAILPATISSSLATTYYVNANGTNPAAPYTSWATAATNIQDAIDASSSGDLVLVTNGVYRSAGEMTGDGATNCVVATNAITIQSVNGATATLITGAGLMRCAFLASNAMMIGFTLTNGSAGGGGGVSGGALSNCSIVGNSGGGVYSAVLNNCSIISNSAIGAAYCTLSNCVITGTTGSGAGDCTLNNCVITNNNDSGGNGGGANLCTLNHCLLSGNLATYGGGASSSTLNYCTLTGNSASWGGGVISSTLNNCLVVGNVAHNHFNDFYSASLGGGTWGGTANNCTIAGNQAVADENSSGQNYSGGGAYGTALNNSIVQFNSESPFNHDGGANYYGGTVSNSCVSPLPSGGTGNFTSDPLFTGGGDYHLQTNSPCINAGNNAFAVGATDLDGNPRIVGLVVDAGAYEFQSPTYFTVQPQSQSVNAGQTATFSGTATGPYPVVYQWFFNGTAIPGATNTTLVITNVAEANDGNYVILASNSTVTVNSATAVLTVVYPPPGIVSQPASLAILTSSNATFSVTATNDIAMTYQWLFNGMNLTDGGNLSGSTSSNLDITAATTNNAGTYQVIVANAFGSVTSTVATLTVYVPAALTLQPTNQTVLWSSNFVVTAAALGTGPLNYQWYFNGTPMADGGRVSGSMSNILSIADAQTNDAGAYQLIVTNNYGSDTSAVAAITIFVGQPATVVTQPTNTTVLVSGTATFAINATGTTNLYYQWYFNGAPLTDGGSVSGSTNATLTIANVQTNSTGAYQAIVVNYFGSDTSAVANLTAWFPAQITNQPASEAVLLGSDATFSAGATGSAITCLWLFNDTPLTDGGRISGSTTPTLTITGVQGGDAGGYVLRVSNLLSAATSHAASLTPQAVLAPSIRYVDASNAAPQSPYLTWSTAATNLQDAVDAAVDGDEVLATNGVYQAGGWAVYGALTNRVAVGKVITVQSVNGPAATVIRGNGPPGNNAVRCVYLTNNAALSGFTLTNGATRFAGDVNREQSGGGIWCEDNSAVISNCVVAGCSAHYYGGAADHGAVFNCLLTNNTAGTSGGGACSNALFNCTLAHNSVTLLFPLNGGGAYACSLSNCVITGNSCGENGNGAGTYSSTLTGCVVSNNSVFFGKGGGVFLGVANDTLIASNSAAYGGGACSNVLNHCVLSRNVATSSGGGAAFGSMTACVVSNNFASGGGGGLFECIANNSLVSSNRATGLGGGAYSNTLYNCLVKNNYAGSNGGGVDKCTLVNCTVVSNTSAITGGGGQNCNFTNCIVYYNTSPNAQDCAVFYSDTFPSAPGAGNITNPPAFVNLAGVDYRLQTNSPCINSGNNAYASGSTDLDGNPRISNGTVDLGAYEFQNPPSVISYAWLQQYGLPTDGSVDHTNLDGTPFDVYQDWIAGLNPTNPASVLAMSSAVSTNRANGVTVTWQSVTNITYYLQRSSDLAAQPVFSPIQSNLVGHAGSTSFTDKSATNSVPYFYRVGVQ